jgi:hypothetical protein
LKTLKIVFISIVLPLIYACSHPIEIVGEGDVWSTGGKTCTLEDYQGGLDNCSKNCVTGAYQETYYAEPRENWVFVHWGNYCTDAIDNSCSFDIPAAVVDQYWFQTIPPLVAKFAPICEAAPADSFAAIQNVIFNDKGCTSGGCHGGGSEAGGLDLSDGNSYQDIFNVTAQSGGGLKLVLPEDANNSYLYQKVSANTDPGSFDISGSPMPLGGTALSSDQLAALAVWIDAGAPQFGRADEFNEVEQLLGLCD